MSAQVKKRFEEMKAYLGRDTVGLDHLKRLKDDVNVLRKNLAAAEERAARAEDLSNAFRAKAENSEMALEESLLRIDSLRQKTESLERNVNELRHEHEATIDTTGGELSQMKSVFSVLKKRFNYLPQTFSAKTDAEEGDDITPPSQIIHLQDICEGWSMGDLWTLGATVALFCARFSGVSVMSTKGQQRIAEQVPFLDIWMSMNNQHWRRDDIKPRKDAAKMLESIQKESLLKRMISKKAKGSEG